MLFDRLFGVLGLVSCTQAEHHLEGDREQQKPAGHAKRGQGDAELPQQPVADQRRADQDHGGDQAGAQRHLAAERVGALMRDREERRHEANRIDHDQERDQRGDQKLDGHRFDLRRRAEFRRAYGAFLTLAQTVRAALKMTF